MTKILIAYFSRKGQNYFSGGIRNLTRGNTEIAAEYIKNAVGGVLLEIETVESYSEDYEECTKQAKREKNGNARPKLKHLPESVAEFDTVFLCYPNWWGTMPMPVFSFLESFDFKGKKIVPLCTHEGSMMGYSEQDIFRTCKAATVMKGLPVQGSLVSKRQAEIDAWARTQI